jgi:hypothetical protein
MAKDGIGTIIGLGVAGVAAYWLYETFFVKVAASAPASTSSSGTVATGTTSTLPAYMANLAALTAQLQTMSGQSGPLNIDQWVYQYNQLRQQRNMLTLTADQVSALLNVNPKTAADRTVPIAASEFTNDIFGLGYGLQGVNPWRGLGALRLASPVMVLPFATRRVRRSF